MIGEALRFDFDRPAAMLRDRPEEQLLQKEGETAPGAADDKTAAAGPAPGATAVLDGLRPYQRAAIEGAQKVWAQGDRGALIVLPTGAGKTRTAGAVIHGWPGRCLWLTHMDTLVQQAQGDLQEVIGEYIDLEQAQFRAGGSRVVIGSVQTLARPARLRRFRPDTFGLIVVDEAHHAPAATYRKVLDYFTAAKVLMVTATPNRMDGKRLEKMAARAFTYGIGHGVYDGYLVQPAAALPSLDSVDLSQLKAKNGDFSDADLSKALDIDEVFSTVVRETMALAGERRTVLFWPSVELAHKAAAAFNDARPDCARAVDGGTMTDKDDKRGILRDHQAGRFQYLHNVGVTAEGYNDPGIECVVIVRPTKSRSAHAQWIGRGTRPLVDGGIDRYQTREERQAAIAASRKPTLLVIDFTTNTGRHGDLSSVVELLAGGADKAVVDEAKKIVKKRPGIRVDEALREGAAAVKARIEAEAKKAAKAKAMKLTWKTIDPFQALGVPMPPPEPGTALLRASGAQRDFLERAGIEVPDDLTHAAAQKLIGTVKARNAAGMASFKQIRVLKRLGVRAPERMYRATASRLMTAAALNKEAGRGYRLMPGELEAILNLGRDPGEEG